MKMLLFLSLLALTCTNCLEEADCQKQASTLVKISFKQKKNGKDTLLLVNEVTADGSVPVYTGTKTVSKLNVSVDPYDTLTELTFHIDQEPDTNLTLSYSRQALLLSPDCGPETILANLSVVQSGFDSVRLILPLISTSKSTNVEIYK